MREGRLTREPRTGPAALAQGSAASWLPISPRGLFHHEGWKEVTRPPRSPALKRGAMLPADLL